MNRSNWRSTIGGAFSALGTSLMGVGIVPQLSGASSKALTYIALAGFICTAIGQFLGHLFAADAKTVQDLVSQVQLNTRALVSGDTTEIKKVVADQTKTP